MTQADKPKPYKIGECFDQSFAELNSKLDSILAKLDDHSPQQDPTKPTPKPTKATASNEREMASLRDENERLQAEKAAIAKEREGLTEQKQKLEKEIADKKKKIAEQEEIVKEQAKTAKEQEATIHKLEQALGGFSKEMQLDLFETYKNLPQEFKKSFTYIQGGSLRSFVVTSGSKETLIALYDYIKQMLKAQGEAAEIIALFNGLFVAYGDIYDFERLVDSKEFEEDLHIRLRTTGRGAISQCYLLGFRDGRTIYKSLVD